MKNSQFANLLKKYVSAKKINSTAATKSFIDAYADDASEAIIPEATPAIRDYATTFIKKGYKCSDSEFTAQMLKYAIAVEEPKVPEATQHYSGEY